MEDEDDVRRAVRAILTRHGCDIVETSDPHEALEILKDRVREIDLLLTDVVMPWMNGRTLAELVRKENSQMRMVFMSGYNDEIMDNHGLTKKGIHLI